MRSNPADDGRLLRRHGRPLGGGRLREWRPITRWTLEVDTTSLSVRGAFRHSAEAGSGPIYARTCGMGSADLTTHG